MPKTAVMVCMRASGAETVRIPPIYQCIFITEDVIEYSFDRYSLLLSDSGSQVESLLHSEGGYSSLYGAILSEESLLSHIRVLWSILFCEATSVIPHEFRICVEWRNASWSGVLPQVAPSKPIPAFIGLKMLV
jgi:hypothetical protein